MKTLQAITKCLADLSQIGLLGLAFYGYFHTIVPVYQKEQLSEEIAKKQLELSEMTKALAAKESQLAEATQTLTSLNASIVGLRQQADSARTQAQAATRNAENEYAKLRERLILDFVSVAQQLCPLSSVPAGQFSVCVTNSVLPHSRLENLRANDKAKLRRIVSVENNFATNRYAEEMAKEAAKTDEEISGLKTAKDAKCALAESLRNSPDTSQKIVAESACRTSETSLNYAMLKADLKKYAVSGQVTGQVLVRIVNRFHDLP